ncbi:MULTISPECIES: STAS domain-containing protein [Bacillaceae]|uniref:STAS domain-containing protein n=1 Tax=Bacillales TaxID=1385 RepID=UPI0018833F0A|nr:MULTISPECIES: STAS domain-containing protein [Bacillaceae]MBF0709470.1 STAS domain-containing protein [Pseudalkalibacillus hwajinpoensis]MDO6658359.1 STAS domain-containing protein [Anaerobacillus sp. 1_MG-2023]WLR58188.1 STAS domain-containing protein [Pseudalkalibacillus hwajinpoensis]
MNLQIKQEDHENTHHLHIAGEIDAYTAPQLREALLPLTGKEGHETLVHLGDVNYMDSTGLGVFVGALKSSKEHGSSLKLTGMTSRVQRLFEITGLDEVIDIEDVKGGSK